MSTKKTTTTTNQYDPSSMTFFKSLQPQMQAGYASDMQLDPTKSNAFNLGLQQQVAAARGANRTQMSNIAGNALFAGGGNLSGIQASMLAAGGRAVAGRAANAFTTNYLNYDTMRRQEMMQASGIKPLQTGQTQVQQTSGLGTWLPQVIGGAAQIGLAAATGGSSAALKVAGGAVGNAAMQTAQGNAGDPGLSVPGGVQWDQNPFNNAAVSSPNGYGFGSGSFGRA